MAFPDDYEACPNCSGTGTVIETRDGKPWRVRCPAYGCHSGSVRKRKRSRVEQEPSPVSSAPRPPATKEEMVTIIQNARAKAAILKEQLLKYVWSVSGISAQEAMQAHDIINSIDTSTGKTTTAFKALLGAERRRDIYSEFGRLLSDLDLCCTQIETYQVLLKYQA